MNNEPVAWAREDGVIAFHKKPEVDSQGFKWFALYTHPAKYCPSENNEAYEKGFIDGMAKQRDSAVQQMVEANTHPVKELTDQLAKYKQVLESIANEYVELSHDKIKWQNEDHIKWAKEALK